MRSTVKPHRLLALLTALLLVGCTAPQSEPPSSGSTPPGTVSSEEQSSVAALSDVPESVSGPADAPETAAKYAPIPMELPTTIEELAKIEIDPPYDFDPDELMPSDFGAYFLGEAPTSRSSEAYLTGTEWQNEMVILEGEQEGPTVFVVAGVHGNERAGYSAGNLLKKISLKAGKLCIISPANPTGAAQNRRYVTEQQDLNRSFPGNASGTAAEQVAHAIYQKISEQKPVILLDLHEASVVQEGRDFLGSSLIFSDLTGMDDLFFDMILESQAGELCTDAFNYYSPGPAGSINRTVTEGLGVPSITVETFRGYPLQNRIADQLAIVQRVLQHYGLTD